MRDASEDSYRFGEFRLDVRDRLLTRDDEVVRLEPKSFDVLCCLVSNAGHLVSKQDLVDKVWARAYVSDNSLTRCIHQIRAALLDDADRPDFIETVPGSGYRFIADVEETEESASTQQETDNRHHRKLAILALVAAIALGAILVPQWMATNSDLPPVQRLAVLPLANLTGEAEQEYFVQGVHDALVAELSRITSIDVISRTSVLGFRNTELGLPEIAKRLGVDALVEGSVMRAGDKLTVTAQLIATEPERHLWAERYHRDVSDLFAIATDIVEAIAAQIEVELSPDPDQSKTPTASIGSDAFEAYLRGRFYFEQRNPEGYRMAQEQFRLAIELEPDFAPPYAGLAHTFGSAAIFDVIEPEDGFPEARRLARKAIELNDMLADAHMILAGVSYYWDWDWDAADKQVRRVLELNANLANAYRLLAEIYSSSGQHAEALQAIERGRQIDPLPATSQVKPALILYLARNHEQAITRLQTALEHYPGFWQAHWLLCLSLAATDRYESAIASCRQAVELSGNLPNAAGALGYALALAGQHDEASAIAAGLEASKANRYVGPASIAIIYGALGRFDEAFAQLGEAYELRDQQLVHANHAAQFDPLRPDPRFKALRERAFRTEQ